MDKPYQIKETVNDYYCVYAQGEEDALMLAEQAAVEEGRENSIFKIVKPEPTDYQVEIIEITRRTITVQAGSEAEAQALAVDRYEGEIDAAAVLSWTVGNVRREA